MSELTAQDLLPLLLKLPHDEQVRLARLALRAASGSDDAKAYEAAPPPADEFGSDPDALAWDGDDWEEFYAPR